MHIGWVRQCQEASEELAVLKVLYAHVSGKMAIMVTPTALCKVPFLQDDRDFGDPR